MKHIYSINEIQDLIIQVRNRRLGFVTNFYFDEFKHNVWVKKHDFFYETINDTVFFLRRSESFINAFYISISNDALKRDLSVFTAKHNKEKCVFDIVGKHEQCLPLLDIFNKNGYVLSTSLVRMVRKTEFIEKNSDFEKISVANKEQVKEVYELLHKYFVAENEQIPYLEELEQYALLGHIHVYEEDNKVIGFMIYELNNSTLYWRYWFVHPEHREKHIGSLLFHRLFYEANKTQRQLLWVIRTNENAKKRQEHYGFKEENMFDFVMSNK